MPTIVRATPADYQVAAARYKDDLRGFLDRVLALSTAVDAQALPLAQQSAQAAVLEPMERVNAVDDLFERAVRDDPREHCVGSVLVPFPQAVDDHQTRNAEYLVERGAAVLLPQGDDLAARLQGLLADLIADPARRLRMAEAARALALPDAAERVADAVMAAIRIPHTTPGDAA